MLRPLLRYKDHVALPNIDILAALQRQRLPSRRSWVQALCLAPLAVPGMRMILAGLSWFEWLKFPGSWLVAALIFVLVHLLLPIGVIGTCYYLARSFWRAKTPVSHRQIWRFAYSTVVIMILSFLGTVSVTTLLEMFSCQLFPALKLTDTCVNYLVQTDFQDWLLNIETYKFAYYHWLVWLVLTAYLYQRTEKRSAQRPRN